MMFGPKLSTVFASRWKALAWAFCILLTAYCTVPSPDETDQGQDQSQGQDRPKSFMGYQLDKGGEKPVNPWAKDAP